MPEGSHFAKKVVEKRLSASGHPAIWRSACSEWDQTAVFSASIMNQHDGRSAGVHDGGQHLRRPCRTGAKPLRPPQPERRRWTPRAATGRRMEAQPRGGRGSNRTESHAGRHGRPVPRQGDPSGRPRARAVPLLPLWPAIEPGLVHHHRKPNMTPHTACTNGLGGIDMTLNVAAKEGRRRRCVGLFVNEF